MRVQSSRPARNGGWLHPLNGERTIPVTHTLRPLPPPTINSTRLIAEWAAGTPQTALHALAGSLGVSEPALTALNAVYAPPHRAWAFVMRDGFNNCVGIRLRAEDGRKWAVRGSRQGIFLPQTDTQARVYVCEGPTDTAAALSIGLYAIGRPSCCCGGDQIKTACKRLGIREAVVVADNDEPGLQGAERVAGELKLRTAIYVPPAKDMREFVKLGGTKQLIESDLKNTCWMNNQ